MDSQEKRALETASYEVINFTNIDSKPFNATWGGVFEVIEAGETVPRPRFKALHYTKHLVNKILIFQKVPWTSIQDRTPLEVECLGEVEAKKIERYGKAAPAPVKAISAKPKAEVKTETKESEATPETPAIPGAPVNYDEDYTVKGLEEIIEARGFEVPDGNKPELVAFLIADDKAKTEPAAEGEEGFDEAPKDEPTEGEGEDTPPVPPADAPPAQPAE